MVVWLTSIRFVLVKTNYIQTPLNQLTPKKKKKNTQVDEYKTPRLRM